MMNFNHVAGGVAFTGIFSSFNDVNIFERPEYLAATVIFSMLPDVDHTKGVIGKVFFPIARYIDRRFGHRTITHSLMALVVIFILSISIESFLSKKTVITQIITLSYLSHLIFDMCTKSGIPFFYPFSTLRCVMPANPKMRISSGDFRAEVIIFFCFIGFNLSAMDLMKDGFWTSYNKAFKTFSHLNREFMRGGQLEIVVIEKKTKKKERGFVIECQEKKAVITSKEGLKEVANDKFKIDQIVVSKSKLSKRELLFFDVAEDSVRKIISKKFIGELVLMSNGDFYYFKDKLKQKGKRAEFKNVSEFIGFEVEKDQAKKEVESIELEIKSIEENEKLEIERFSTEKRVLDAKKAELRKIESFHHKPAL